jgi:hypothetical protein
MNNCVVYTRRITVGNSTFRSLLSQCEEFEASVTEVISGQFRTVELIMTECTLTLFESIIY